MGRLFSLLKGVESSIRSRLGMWMQEVSLAGDSAASAIAALQGQNVIPDGSIVGQSLTWNEVVSSEWAPSGIAPLYVPVTDWATFIGIVNAAAFVGRSVQMGPGTWTADTVEKMESGAYVIGGPKVVVNQTLTSGTGNALVAAFAMPQSAAVASSDVDTTTTYGSRTLKCTSDAGAFDAAAVVGAWLRITSAADPYQVKMYQIMSTSVGGGVNTFTVERPLRIVWAANDVVEVIVPNSVRIEGNGMTVTGNGSRLIELFTCLDGYVADVNLIAGTLSERLMSWDVCNVGCRGIRIRGDGRSTAILGLTFETGEDSAFEDCEVVGCQHGYSFQDENVGSLINCRARGCSASGATLTAASGTAGSNECEIVGGDYSGNLGGGVVGILIEKGSSRNRIQGARVIGNGSNGISTGFSGTQTGNVIDGCVVTDNAAAGIALSAQSVDTVVSNTTLLRNTSASTHLNVDVNAAAVRSRFFNITTDGIFMQAAADVQVDGVSAVQTTAVGTVFIYFTGGKSHVRGLDLTVPPSGVYGVDPTINAIQLTGTAKVSIIDAHVTIGTNVAAFVTAAAGAVLCLANVEVDKSGAGTHFGAYAAAGTIRLGQRVKISNVSNPTYGGGQFSIGTVQLNGATPVDVTWPDLNAEDHVSLTLQTVAGTQGPLPKVVKTAGTKFTVTGTALDTSTYEYRVE